MGRPRVRVITASISRSYHMLIAPHAPAPTAIHRIAVTARAGWIVTGASSIPVSAVKTTSDITRGLRSATSADTGGPSDRTACCSVGISMLALDQRKTEERGGVNHWISTVKSGWLTLI